MARPFMFAALCWRVHPLKHSLAESTFVSRVQKTVKKIFVSRKNSLAGLLISRGITVYFVTPRIRVLLENKTVIYFSQVISHPIWNMMIQHHIQNGLLLQHPSLTSVIQHSFSNPLCLRCILMLLIQ